MNALKKIANYLWVVYMLFLFGFIVLKYLFGWNINPNTVDLFNIIYFLVTGLGLISFCICERRTLSLWMLGVTPFLLAFFFFKWIYLIPVIIIPLLLIVMLWNEHSMTLWFFSVFSVLICLGLAVLGFFSYVIADFTLDDIFGLAKPVFNIIMPDIFIR